MVTHIDNDLSLEHPVYVIVTFLFRYIEKNLKNKILNYIIVNIIHYQNWYDEIPQNVQAITYQVT